MAKVLGVGGIFFKGDAEALRDWYARVLGIAFSQWGSAEFVGAAGARTVLAPFKAETDYFAPSTQPFMINLLVEGLDDLLAKAEAEGATILGRQSESYGSFAWLMDPAGVKLELWEPAKG